MEEKRKVKIDRYTIAGAYSELEQISDNETFIIYDFEEIIAQYSKEDIQKAMDLLYALFDSTDIVVVKE